MGPRAQPILLHGCLSEKPIVQTGHKALRRPGSCLRLHSKATVKSGLQLRAPAPMPPPGVGWGAAVARGEPGQEQAELPTSGCLSPSVHEKGKDLVIQELATCLLTQDLLHEEVRQAWPWSPHPSPLTPQLDPVWTTADQPALAPRTAASWTKGESRSMCGRDAGPTPRSKGLPSARLW